MCLPAKRVEAGTDSVLEVAGVGKVVVDRTNDMCEDETGVMMVRPEKFRISEEEPDSGAENRIAGTVEATVYLGAVVHVHFGHRLGRTHPGARAVQHDPSCGRLSSLAELVGSGHLLPSCRDLTGAGH